jgi:hypothetical protein
VRRRALPGQALDEVPQLAYAGRFEPLKQRDRVGQQRHFVFELALHLLGRDAPNGGVKVDLRPQLAPHSPLLHAWQKAVLRASGAAQIRPSGGKSIKAVKLGRQF